MKKPVKPQARKISAKSKAPRPRVKSTEVKKVVAKVKSTGSVEQPAVTGKNANLRDAKTNKNDEFYTQWVDIEREMNAYLEYDPNVFLDKVVLLPCDDPEWSNFAKFFALHFMDYGIKKLIATSYAPNSKPPEIPYQPTLFESEAPQYDATKTRINGKMYVLEAKDINQDGVVNIEDLQWEYLEGDGDFRSDEVTSLRNEADIVITNPPFSLFREFLAWLMEGEVQFSIIGNFNVLTYKEVFPLVRDGKLWIGKGFSKGDAYFRVPESARTNYASGVYKSDTKLVHFRNTTWFTNVDHGRRHEPLRLMTMADNIKHSKRKVVRDLGYRKYDNYDAIEVPFTEAIPSDYQGVMGVPISFLDKFNPDQFEIIGMAKRGAGDPALKSKVYTVDDYPNYSDLNAGPVLVTPSGLVNTYPRILIKHKGVAQ
jgi:hypothetical protein